MSTPPTSNMVVVKCILQYGKGTLDRGLVFRPLSPSTRPSAFFDPDWVDRLDSWRSTSGYLIYLGSNIIFWCSKKQPTDARSSAESEYRSLLAHAWAETTWLSYLLFEFGVTLKFPIILHCDNLSATYVAADPVFHSRTCHIELDYPFVHEKVAIKRHQVMQSEAIAMQSDSIHVIPHQ